MVYEFRSEYFKCGWWYDNEGAFSSNIEHTPFFFFFSLFAKIWW